jgi:dTDP-4-amino-4,6-dideoxygalactose transaminase
MSEPKVNWWRTDLGDAEIAALSGAIRARHVNLGPLCAELERRLARSIGAPNAAVTTSGSVALLLSMIVAGVRPGDEVIVPACTFIAPAHAALLLGAKVRLVDVGAERPLIDPAAAAAAVTERTRAIVAVHLNGRACDVAALRSAAKAAGAKVIEDCAQALCSRGPQGALGTLGDIAAFSLGITKLVTTGEGGFVVARDPGVHDAVLKLRNHGTVDIARNRFEQFGCNFRMTDLQAAVGLAQLERLEQKIAGVRRVHAYYREHLAGLGYLRLLEVREQEGELPLWSEALCTERDRVVARLRERGIEAKPFHPTLEDSPHVGASEAFPDAGRFGEFPDTRGSGELPDPGRIGEFSNARRFGEFPNARRFGELPNARRFAALGLTLPSGPDQPEAALARTAAVLRELDREITTPLPV